MSIIKKHDIVDNILTMEDLEKRIHDIIGEKKRWEEMNESERDKLIKLCQSKCLKEKNIEFKLSYPFMKQTTIDTFEIFSGTIARNNQSVLLNLKTNKRVNFKDDPEDVNSEFIVLPIDVNSVSAFKNMFDKWLYFKLSKIEIEYRNNSKASFVPISCQYLPPCSERVKATTSCINNIKLASGTGPEHKSILNPFYIIRTLKNGAVALNPSDQDYQKRIYEDTIPTSGLQDGLFVSNFDVENYYLDYGRFVFSTMNLTNPQDVLIKVKYSFKFYTHANPEDFYGKDNEEE